MFFFAKGVSPAQKEELYLIKKRKKKQRTVKRDYKARIFEMIYRDKKELLELYNDVSFIIDSRLSLYEHQSTYNPNLPLLSHDMTPYLSFHLSEDNLSGSVLLLILQQQ